MKLKILLIFLLALGFTSSSYAAQGIARIMSTSTNSILSGVAHFEDTPGGLKISVTIENAPPGEHGFHIHEFGSCDDQGKAAGGHFNPLNAPHGNMLMGDMHKAHQGDFGNVTIKSNGTGTLNALIPSLSLADGRYTVGGRALIFHQKVDDFSQPVGNAGARIGCGTIIITAP